MPTLPTFHKGNRYVNDDFQTFKSAIQERLDVFDGGTFTIPNQTGRKQRISLINTLRSGLETALGGFLNTNVHAGGDLQGFGSRTLVTWTKATVLAAAGVGGTDGFGNRNWTNIPPADQGGDAWDLAHFSGQIYGSTVPGGIKLYDVWLNELAAVCRKLTCAARRLTTIAEINGPNFATEVRSSHNSFNFFFDSCSEAVGYANTKWDEDIWSAPSGTLYNRYFEYFNGLQSYGAFLDNTRGRIYADLSALTGQAAPYAYFHKWDEDDYLSPDGFTGNNTWQPLAAATVGSTYQSQILGGTKAALTGTCPLGGGSRGWWIADHLYVHTPIFNYT